MPADRAKVWVPVAVLAASALVVFAIFATRPEIEAAPVERLAPLVEVVTVEPGDVRFHVEAQGTVVPRNESDLIPQVSGEVVWDEATDTGFMVFTGLAGNDPTELQYQLWIFDAERRIGDLPQFAIDGFPAILTQRPVDGGVFDSGDGEVIIPIDAKLPVGQAALFAITVEPPGGVVVSDRDIVTAALPG